MSKVTDILGTVLDVAVPLVQVVAPQSGPALKLAEGLASVTKYLEFGTTVIDSLEDFAKSLKDIRAEIEEDVRQGKDTIDVDKWNQLKGQLDTKSYRIEQLLADRQKAE